ncbi:MAG TPA: shikimate dehydrogenase [Solirubrobacteraceae bacterium]|nr:shikimate dehydrogenase [Solirubrobacteraceae bacterium]
MRARLGVLGWPVAHSRSPAMHNAALAHMGIEGWRYQLLPVPPALLEQTVRALPASGFAGANVTIPHKQRALAMADSAGDAALAIGAANTLTFADGGAIAAENTDAPGLLAALGREPRGERALVLGAGGSARAAVWALAQASAREVSIWNRTPGRARALAEELGVRAVSEPVAAELLVNCTSVGLEPGADGDRHGAERELSALGLSFAALGSYETVVDLVYRAGAQTALVQAATAHGARVLDGLEVLVHQGALSLELWTGRKAPLEVMRAAARAA